MPPKKSRILGVRDYQRLLEIVEQRREHEFLIGE